MPNRFSSARSATSAVAALAVALAFTMPANEAAAQSFGDRLKKKAEEAAKRAAEQKVEKKAGDAVNSAMDKAETVVKCAASDKACAEAARTAGKPVQVVPDGAATASGAGAANGGSSSGAPGTAAADALKPGEGAWANYDFKPGSRILFAEDFGKDEVGDFPRRLEFQQGSMEIVEWQGGRWLRLTTDSKFDIPLPETLPAQYTMEFDYALGTGEMWIYPSGSNTGNPKCIAFTYLGAGGVGCAAQSTYSPPQEALRGKVAHARVMADGAYIKVYVNDTRVANIPNFGPARANKIHFYVDGDATNPTLFGNFRIAAGGKRLYDALAADGRVATQGIFFDSGSDRLRPESSPTLKEIATMLTEHADLKLVIEGHTDNAGAAAANMSLSEQRAAAVKAALVTSYGVDGSRLMAKGMGQTKPAAPNTAPEGRAQNRRVELVKM